MRSVSRSATPGAQLRVLALAGCDLRLLLGAHPPGTRECEVVGGVAAAVPDDPLLAVAIGVDVPDAVVVLLRRVLEHLVGMFEHVAIGVDELQIDSRVGDGHLVLLLCVHGTARGRYGVAWKHHAGTPGGSAMATQDEYRAKAR